MEKGGSWRQRNGKQGNKVWQAERFNRTVPSVVAHHLTRHTSPLPHIYMCRPLTKQPLLLSQCLCLETFRDDIVC